MTINFQGIARQIVASEDRKALTLQGPKVSFCAVQNVNDPNQYAVFNSRMTTFLGWVDIRDAR